MKKNSIYLFSFVMTALLCGGFISCGGDDGESSSGGGTVPTNAGTLDHDSNKRIKSVGNCSFYYKDNGQLDYIINSSRRYDFNYDPNTIVETYNGAVKTTYNVSYNSSGFLTRIEFNKSYSEGKNTETHSVSTTLTYGSSEHLVAITSNNQNEYKNVKGYGTLKTTLNWQNNILTSVVCDESEQEDGGVIEYYRETYTYNYDNASLNDYHNKHHQYTPSIVKFMGDEFGDDDLGRALAYVGLLGRGPLYLPISSVDLDEDINSTSSNPYHKERNRSFSYGFNSDGSLSYTIVDNSRYNFGYENLSK